MLARRVACLFPLLGLLWSGSALANGRYPRADQLLVDPSDSTHLVLRATFGVLLSHDAGKSWSWVCESGLGYTGDVDPALAVFADGSVAVAYPRDLVVSRDDGCDWSSTFSKSAKESFVDATLDVSEPSRALFLSRRTDAAHLTHLVSASQTATTPESLGSALGDDLSPLTLEIAPSQPSRIYVTALSKELTGLLLRSDDHGQSWQRFSIQPDETLAPYIAAVDPADPDRVYLRLDGPTSDALLVSDDGGESFDEAFSLDSDLLGFALSPDGQRVALGGPGAGLFVADAARLEFAPSPASFANLSCLKWTEDALFACADEKTDGFTLATSRDSGHSFSPLFHVQDLVPLSCDAKSDVGARCPSSWPSVAQRLGVDAAPGPFQAAGGGCGCAVPSGRSHGFGALVLLGIGLARRRSRPLSALAVGRQ